MLCGVAAWTTDGVQRQLCTGDTLQPDGQQRRAQRHPTAACGALFFVLATSVSSESPDAKLQAVAERQHVAWCGLCSMRCVLNAVLHLT